MKITIESTIRMAMVNGVPARVWEGTTASGLPVVCLITRIATPAATDQAEFKRDLQECKPPSEMAVDAIPSKMVI